YQYPRQAPFRFPVIEDEGGEASVDRPERQRPRKANKRVNKQARKRPQRKGQEIYLNEEQMKTIQDVPTYLRRKRSVEAEEPDELVEDESNLEKEDRCLQEEDFPHTTPDELDAIFKKRDHLNKAPREEKEESRLGNIEGPHQL